MIDIMTKQELTDHITDLEVIVEKNIARQKNLRRKHTIARRSAKTDLDRSRYRLKLAQQELEQRA